MQTLSDLRKSLNPEQVLIDWLLEDYSRAAYHNGEVYVKDPPVIGCVLISQKENIYKIVKYNDFKAIALSLGKGTFVGNTYTRNRQEEYRNNLSNLYKKYWETGFFYTSKGYIMKIRSELLGTMWQSNDLTILPRKSQYDITERLIGKLGSNIIDTLNNEVVAGEISGWSLPLQEYPLIDEIGELFEVIQHDEEQDYLLKALIANAILG
jgi:hypothetical protein